MLPTTDSAALGKQNDGYRTAKAPADGVPMLRNELLALLQGARFWDKPCDWMQARASLALGASQALILLSSLLYWCPHLRDCQGRCSNVVQRTWRDKH